MLIFRIDYGSIVSMKTNKPKIHVDIDPDLKLRLKVIAARRGENIRAIITQLVAEYVKKNRY